MVKATCRAGAIGVGRLEVVDCLSHLSKFVLQFNLVIPQSQFLLNFRRCCSFFILELSTRVRIQSNLLLRSSLIVLGLSSRLDNPTRVSVFLLINVSLLLSVLGETYNQRLGHIQLIFDSITPVERRIVVMCVFNQS